ncbi:integrase core domain-containing protein [Microbacterium lacticum]|uniref:integrase core domain-containing protein n=1 Tax=Microbacterium lacticum TaxID=33885 RepID=UPI003D35FC47
MERYHRTMATEWLYSRAWTSNEQRQAALQGWLDYYNYHRPHSSLGARQPISRCTAPAVTNLAA